MSSRSSSFELFVDSDDEQSLALVQAEAGVYKQDTSSADEKALVLYNPLPFAKSDSDSTPDASGVPVIKRCDEVADDLDIEVIEPTDTELQEAKASLPDDAREHWLDRVLLFIPRLFINFPREDLHLSTVLVKHRLQFNENVFAFRRAYKDEDMSRCTGALERQRTALRKVVATLSVREPCSRFGNGLCSWLVGDMPRELEEMKLAVDVLQLKFDVFQLLDRAGIARNVEDRRRIEDPARV